MNRFFFLALFLVACGNSEKVAPKQSIDQSGKKDQVLACAEAYNPISMNRPGSLPLPNVDAVPPGRYSVTYSEYHLKEVQDGVFLQSHFEEDRRNGGVLTRSICYSTLPKQRIVDFSFPYLTLYSSQGNPLVKSYRSNQFLMQLADGKMASSTQQNNNDFGGDILQALNRYPVIRMYVLGDGSLEIRANYEMGIVGHSLQMRMRQVLKLLP